MLTSVFVQHWLGLDWCCKLQVSPNLRVYHWNSFSDPSFFHIGGSASPNSYFYRQYHWLLYAYISLHLNCTRVWSDRKKLFTLLRGLGIHLDSPLPILPSESSIWATSARLAVLTNVSFGASVVAMNSYLPSLAKESSQVIEAHRVLVISSQEQHGESRHRSSPELDHENLQTPLISHPIQLPLSCHHHPESDIVIRYRERHRESRRLELQWAMLRVFSCSQSVEKLRGSTFALRLAIGVSGIWWAIPACSDLATRCRWNWGELWAGWGRWDKNK